MTSPKGASSGAPSGSFGAKSSGKNVGPGGVYKIGFVQESAISLRKKSVAELGAGVHQSISDVSYVKFLQWIRSERLTTLPHEGSQWDKVLIRALYFAEQLHKFDQAIQSFALDSQVAAAIGYGHARLLLELGNESSAILDKAFSVLYKFSLSISSVLRRSELLAATAEIREQLCLLYTDLISLVVDVSVKFYKASNGVASGSANLDISELFGETIEGFRKRQSSVVELIWKSQIEKEDPENREVLEVDVLSRWLSSQDKVITTLNRDHSFLVDHQVEMTCIWFQKHLTGFLQSDKSVLLVTGQPQSGKTTLAGSIVERLQRPVNRKQVNTLFCTLSADVPTSATSLAVVKSLLSQLLNQRVGNMAMYHALSRAYRHCRVSGDQKAYEEHLWQALEDTLKQPFDGSDDLVMVVDGIDGIEASQSTSISDAGSMSSDALLDRLVNITNQGQKVRLIALSSTAEMPSQACGMLHEVSPEDIREDLHAVALRALDQNPNFQSNPGDEQETLIDRIVETADGSFLRAILACEILNSQESMDAITATLQDLEVSKPPVQDLVHMLFNSVESSSNAETLLSWILAAKRPFTSEEIHTLFTIDVKSGTLMDKGFNVHETLQTLKPFLLLNEHIVRFKHPVVHSALHDLAQMDQIPIPLEDSETDLLLRVLTYARFTLRDKGEPTAENQDPSVADRLFRQNCFLEYAVRYWVIHLQKSPLMPQSIAEFVPTEDLQRVFPGTTTLPILEQIVWGIELSIPEAIDLFTLVGNVRRAIYTENHPAVLQSFLAIAKSYLLISDTTSASSYFSQCTKISRTVLSDAHPLTLECANQFLKASEPLATNTRTEIMTQREDILDLLTAAYERQYGSTSDIVIQTRKLQVELYASLKEEQKALDTFGLIQDATIQRYGRNSQQAQEIKDHLSSVLSKDDDDEDRIDSYKESSFDNYDDAGQAEECDFDSVIAYQRRAETYASREQPLLAERTYVELWQQISSKCRTTQSIEWHEKNIEIATTYSQFLKAQNRTTEASAVLAAVWEQYQHNQLSYLESIVTRLTDVAKEMKSVGSYTMALSIFKHAGFFYKNVCQKKSSASQDIDDQMSETSKELVRQSLEASSLSSGPATNVSEPIYKDVFFSVIQSSEAIDSATAALAKKLSAEYMEEQDFIQAISIIQATLQRTWPSFLSSSLHDAPITPTLTQESIELVEHLAECYLELKQMGRVEDTYSRFFRAALVTKDVDENIFEKSRALLIGFYDKYGYQDSAISVYQDILVAYRTKLGPNHEFTIHTLYTLAHRCRQHPRNHPYWIEYYLQITSNLNRDSEVCHKDAMDAIVVIATTYWQDRRYSEAVPIYRTLWNTFVLQTKEHKIFNESDFVRALYERYCQCLEETMAGFDSLYQVTKEYRDAVIATLGPQSTVAVEATLALARVSQRSEEHIPEAISLYEEALESIETNPTTATSSELNQALSSLYVRQMKSQTASDLKAEHIERALSMTQEQLNESSSKHGYSHESSLTHVRELATMYQRQQRSDSAVKTLANAVSQIVLNETSSQKQIESAASIAASFYACQQTSAADSLVQELHRQICAKDGQNISEWSFDVTKSDRVSLAFLASLQYTLRKDPNVTFAEIMASLTMEYIYFEQFRKMLQNNESLAKILLAAAPLHFFLRQNGQDEMITIVEDQAVGIFEKGDAQDLHTLSNESTHIFIVSVIEHLGTGKNKNFNHSVILASNDSTAKLTKARMFSEAYDIANLGFLYASNHDGYNGPKSIGMGFKLAFLLVGRDSEKATDVNLRTQMLELSNKIIRTILDICKNLTINFGKIQLSELSHLSELLGEQNDYTTLEWLLTTLWNNREAQRSWPAEVLLNLGRRLICARYLAGSAIKAISLAEDIAYNTRRTHGPRSPVTIETYELLAQLYTSMGQKCQTKASEKTVLLAQEYFKKAFGVHEDILRHFVHENSPSEDSDDELDITAYLLAKEGVDIKKQEDQPTETLEEDNIDKSAIVLHHLHLLKLAYQRLGGWPKAYEEYERLNAQIFRIFGSDTRWEGVQGTEKWSANEYGNGKAESKDGSFEGFEDWALGSDKLLSPP